MRRIFCGFWLVLILPVAGAEIKLTFGDVASNGIPAGFHAALAGGGRPGEWKIIMDAVPPLLAPLSSQALVVARRAVVAQTGSDPTDERFPMLIYDGETFKDFSLATHFKIAGGTVEQMAGVVFRYQNESNCYVLRASALGNNVRFYKVVGGIRSDPIGPEQTVSTNTWHVLGVQCQGNQITCWLDGQLLMPPLHDDSFGAGKIGFRTKSDAIAYFGDTTVIYTPRLPRAQAVLQNVLKEQPRIVGLRLYTLDDGGRPRVLASKEEKEIGQAGTDSELDAIRDGKVYFGRTKGTVVVTLPLRDRNGDPIAAVRVELKSFLGETQDNAVTRGMMVVKTIQERVTSKEELAE
ncbi:MAG TPA: family 16 glycoside hydrolase [Candidatus Acidoferrum sp.]|nr:family 16 glycoside hydrolase [Candidatus Acidoferrum sp.]